MASAPKTIGNYHLVAKIACGSFGCVYRSEHKTLKNRIVAIKLMHNAHFNSQEEQDVFLEEAQVLAMLDHPHILPIFDVGVDDGFPYLITEYAPNGSLLNRLKREPGKPLPMEEAGTILLQIGLAVQHAHEQGIVHRDLKPENVLFKANGDVLLADFGIAKVLATAGIRQGTIIGTPPYMAPEQFGGTASKEGDQYALGCIAYELFTGQRPFTASDFIAMGFKHVTEQPIPPTQHNPHLPAHIEQAILKAMAKKREDRHVDVAAFMKALEQATVGAQFIAPASDFPMFGYDLAHTRFNPHEHLLSPTNVSRLVPLWSAATGGEIYSSPAVANGVVYVGSTDRKLYAFDGGMGKPLWSAATSYAIFSSPAVANGVVYIGSFDSKLYAFGASTGKPLWSAATGGSIYSSPAVANGVVYVGSDDTKLYAFEASMGKPLWSAATGDRILSSPAVANGVVYVGSWDKKLYAFEAGTGKPLWSAATGDRITSSPAVANGVVYVGSDDTKLYAFEASMGKLLWSVATGDRIDSSPAVANGVVYVGSWDGKLYAFHLP